MILGEVMTNQGKQSKYNEVIIFGASGHAKVVIDIIEKQDVYKVKCLVDDDLSLKECSIYGYRVAGDREEIRNQECNQVLVAIGDNRIRFTVAHWLEDNGFCLAGAVIHPSAQLSRGVDIGMGCTLMAGSVVNADSIIGKNTILNTGATIDHDCIVADTVHIAPGVTVCGGVTIGSQTLIGAGSVIHPNITIGKNVIVGAGATVVNDIVDGAVVVGSPAKMKA